MAGSGVLRFPRGRPKMGFPLVLELAADGVLVAVPCRVLGVTRQAFSAGKKQSFSDRVWDDAHLIDAAFDGHRDDPTFGYRFLAEELRAAGFTASERRVLRVCSQQRIWSVFAKKRGLARKAGPPVHEDRVRRVFAASGPNRVWLTDITEHNTGRARCISARSRTCTRTGSSDSRSTRG